MQMTVNVAGQVGQIKLGQNKALWPLFETVINSIQSLEDTKTDQKQIIIEALRNPDVQIRLNKDGSQSEEPSHFEQFVVTDNGNGFNEANFKSFQEAYSQLKVKKGCKGIGRFLWLKAFEKVSISSTYQENGKWYRREFEFTLSGISPDKDPEKLEGSDYANLTRITLMGFISKYRNAVAYNLESLAKKIIEHCLPYFIMNAVPAITLKDNRGESFSLNDYYNSVYKDSLNQDSIDLKGRHYQLFHMLLAQGAEGHELHLCANNREVKSIDLYKKIPNLEKGKKLPTDSGDVYYVGYLSGDYLDESINVERSEFDFEDASVLGDEDCTEEEIVNAAVEMIRGYLKNDLNKVGNEKRKQIDRLVQATRPQYRLLLNKRPEVYDEIPSGLTEDKLDLELYKCQQQWEYDTAKQKCKIEEKIRQNATDDIDFNPLFDEYCGNINELSRAGLAEYVVKRKAIIDLLGKALEVEPSGSYSLESRIHRIICPMQVSSEEVKLDDMNLWLIDDRLAYHHYLASDKYLSKLPVLDNKTQKRTDLIIFDAALSFTAETDDINSITIVELKRPQRDDDQNDPVWQVLKYVRNIREGKIKKDNGRDFGDMNRVKFYCYVIGDLTQSMRDSAEGRGLRPMQDNEGYYGYNEGIGAYVEVISYNKLLKNARQRNQVFFDKLFASKASDLKHPELLEQ